MGTTHFLFGIHCHQPTDNFDHVVHDAIIKSYRPFFEVACRFETFRFSVHFSGWLLEYIQEHDNELFRLMQQMAMYDQMEFLSGGFYEPILSAIPSQDRIDQVIKLNNFIEIYFNQTPRGLWLTERVWDSSIITDMKICGIEYVIVDDYHFSSSGFDEKELHGYYLSENAGEVIGIFPINKKLRYLIPFREVDEAIDYLLGLDTMEDKCAVLFDDGEKFGVWPKTYEWVYESGWLEQFLRALSAHPSIRPTTYSDYFDTHHALGLAYLPPTSYYEMGEWSLKAHDAILMERMRRALNDFGQEEQTKFLKGSIWKNFLIKYYESNHIHKRILELSALRNKINEDAYDEWLFKAQTNDVLWHGIFGGLYLPNLRDNVYRFIVQAENIRYGKLSPRLEINDFNMDSYSDLKFVCNRFIALFDSRLGAQMSEFSLRDVCFNLQNTLRRYEESYHDKILHPDSRARSEHSEGIDTIHTLTPQNIEIFSEKLAVDWYAKNSFIDHITDITFDAQQFEQCCFKEYGDFANQPFSLLQVGDLGVTFKRTGGIYMDSVKYDCVLSKTYDFSDQGIEFKILLHSQYFCDLFYVLEMNMHFSQIDRVKINGQYIGKYPFSLMQSTVVLDDPYIAKKITIKVNTAQMIVIASTNTVSQNECGFEFTNQGISIGFVVPYNQNMSITGSLTLETQG